MSFYGSDTRSNQSPLGSIVITIALIAGFIFLVYWIFFSGGEDFSKKTPEELVEMKEYQAALERYQKMDQSDPEVALGVARCHIGLKDTEKAKEGLSAFVKEYAKDTQYDAFTVEALGMLASLSDNEEKIGYLWYIVTDFPDQELSAKYAEELGDYYYKDGKGAETEWWKAREAYGIGELSAVGDAQTKLRRKLDKINKKLLLSPYIDENYVAWGLMKDYEVQPGDSPNLIIKKERVASAGLIERVNNLGEGALIHPGDKLKLLTGNVKIVVEKSKFRLTLYYPGKDNERFLYLKEYKVGIGKDETRNRTPEGEFKVVSQRMKKDPEYKGLKAGDPKNPLGTRWIPTTRKGIGIHGNNNPGSIGTRCSEGCVRMYNEEVEDLYDFVRDGDEVIIKP